MPGVIRNLTINPDSGSVGRTVVGGTWTITIGEQTTSALEYNISSADLKTALEALSSVGSGKVVDCQGSYGGFTVTFAESLGEIGSVTVTTTSLQVRLADDDLTITETTPGTDDSGVNETQLIKIKVDEEAVDPYYSLSFDAEATGNISGASDPGSELNNLSSIQAVGGVSTQFVEVDGEGFTVYRVTFNELGNMSSIEAGGTNEVGLTRADETAGSLTPGDAEVQTITKPGGTTLVGGTWTVGESGQWGYAAAYDDTVGDIAGQIGTVGGSGNWTTGMVFTWADPGDQPNLTVHCNLIATGLAFGSAVAVSI